MMTDARLTIARLNLSDCLVTPQSTDMFLQCLRSYASMTPEQGEKAQVDTVASVEKMYGITSPADTDRKPFIYSDGMAIIPVHGVLLNRFGGCWGFVTGYNYIRAMLNAALADDDVTLIVFDVNSPGGDAAGCFELTEEIRASRNVKPSIAVVDDLAASGGYAVPAAATRMVATQSSSVGSIGVYRLHVDVSGANEQQGVVYTFVYAGEHKVDGNPFEALPDNVRADMQESVDQRYAEFVADVVASRGLSEDDVRATEARVYRSQEALAKGLIDDVRTPTEAVSAFLAELASDEPEDEDEQMALPKTEAELATLIENAKAEGASSVQQPDTAKIVADAVKADRERRDAILALDEAKDKPKLAASLANKDMSVEVAKSILADAAAEKQEAAPQGGGKSPLDNAMEQSGGGAQVKVEGEPEGSKDAPKPSDNILAFIPADRQVKK